MKIEQVPVTGKDRMHSNASPGKLPTNYFLLVLVLSIPFWLIGGNKLPIPVNLPVSALMFINPLIAASILSYRLQGVNGIRELLKKTFDYKKIKNRIWYLPALLLIPSMYGLSYVIMRLTGMPLPDPINIPFSWRRFSSSCSLSAPRVKSWVGRDTLLTQCKIGGGH